MVGIYKITNKLNGKSYIGQAHCIEMRKLQHFAALRSSGKSWYPEARHECGNVDEDFEFTILQECSPDELDELEEYWINYYDSYNNGYNHTKDGQSICNTTNSGIKLIIEYAKYNNNFTKTLLIVLKGLSKLKISYSEKILVILLLSQIDNKKDFFFNETWIKEHTGISHDTYIAARKHLSELGIIKCDKTNSLTLLVDNILKLTADQT